MSRYPASEGASERELRLVRAPTSHPARRRGRTIPEDPDTVGQAVDKVTSLSRELVSDQIELARLELVHSASQILKGWTWMMLAAGLAVVAWCALSGAAWLALQPLLPSWAALLLVALGNGAMAGVAIWRGRVRMRHGDPGEAETDEAAEGAPRVIAAQAAEHG